MGAGAADPAAAVGVRDASALSDEERGADGGGDQGGLDEMASLHIGFRVDDGNQSVHRDLVFT